MKKIKCPACGRIEVANVLQEDLALCSRCLMSQVTALEMAERKAKQDGQTMTHEKAVPRPTVKGGYPNPKIVCKKCGGGFRAKSNRQEFCIPCGKQESLKRESLRSRGNRLKVKEQ